MNSKKQGDAGLGQAIAYFTSKGICVCIPLTDSQEYDLVIDDAGLKKVQVKMTTFRKTPRSPYRAELRVKGGNKTGTGKTKHFDNKAVDLLFICAGSDQYLIPAGLVGRNQITLTKKYQPFKVR